MAIVVRIFDAQGRASATPVRFLGRARSFQPVNMLEEDAGKAGEKTLALGPYDISKVKIQ